MSLMKRTNQLWKLYVFATLMALGAGTTLFQSLLHGRFGKEITTYLAIGGMLLVTGVFAWAYIFITCPNCKLKIFWHAITKEGLGSWFPWLINQEECPQCGSRDGLSTPRNKRGRSDR